MFPMNRLDGIRPPSSDNDLQSSNLKKIIYIFAHNPHLFHEKEAEFLTKFLEAPHIDSAVLSKLANASDLFLNKSLSRNCAKAEEVTKALYYESLNLKLLCMERPNLLIYSKDKFVFIRNSTPTAKEIEQVELEILDLERNKFSHLGDVDLYQLQGSVRAIGDNETEPLFDGLIKESDLLLLFDKIESSSDEYPVYYKEYTEKPVPSGLPFYHEKQFSGFCALHAGNAFLGKKMIIPSAYSAFIQSTMTSLFEEDREIGNSLATALKVGLNLENGSDPSTLVLYLQKLAKEGMIAKKFADGLEGRIYSSGSDLCLKTEESFDGKIISNI